jgi:hypothetical protein
MEIAMRNLMNPVCYPEGFGGAPVSQRQRDAGGVAMASSPAQRSAEAAAHDHDRFAREHGYDDGLVHGHAWAMSPNG